MEIIVGFVVGFGFFVAISWGIFLFASLFFSDKRQQNHSDDKPPTENLSITNVLEHQAAPLKQFSSLAKNRLPRSADCSVWC